MSEAAAEKPKTKRGRSEASLDRSRRKHRIRQKAYVLLGQKYPRDLAILELAVEQQMTAEEAGTN